MTVRIYQGSVGFAFGCVEAVLVQGTFEVGTALVVIWYEVVINVADCVTIVAAKITIVPTITARVAVIVVAVEPIRDHETRVDVIAPKA